MQQNVRKVVTGGAQPEKLDVSHMRKPSDRVPIGFRGGGEGPGYAGAGETLLHVMVIGDVGGVVVADEAASQRVCVEGEGDQPKEYREQERRVTLQPPLPVSGSGGRKFELGRTRRRTHLFTNS